MNMPPCRPGDDLCRPGHCVGDVSVCDEDDESAETSGDVEMSPVTPVGGQILSILCCINGEMLG